MHQEQRRSAQSTVNCTSLICLLRQSGNPGKSISPTAPCAAMELLAVGSWQVMLEPSRGSLLMKIDIEGAEWPTLGTASTATLRKFRQLLIECPGSLVWCKGQLTVIAPAVQKGSTTWGTRDVTLSSCPRCRTCRRLGHVHVCAFSSSDSSGSLAAIADSVLWRPASRSCTCMATTSVAITRKAAWPVLSRGEEFSKSFRLQDECVSL